MKNLNLILLVFVIHILPNAAFSAPMPEIGPMTIEGNVEEVTWSPETHIKGIPGMSGTAGVDRTFPAHYKVTLTNTDIDISEDSWEKEKFKSGNTVEIVIYHKKDDGFLKKGMRIKVLDYRINGDEGGYWYSFSKIEVIKPEKQQSSK